jgi:hypothetical protein
LNAQPSTLTTSVNNGNGTYTSPSFTPSGPGSYQWVATYSGDASNASISTNCNDPNEVSTINKLTPTIQTTATSPVTVGSSVQDTATVSGGNSPTGSVTFTLYSDSGCTKSIFTDTETLTNGQATSKSFTPANTGSYYWIASYGGDSNNAPVSGHCGDNGETSVVNPVTPTIQTSATSGAVGQSIQDTATVSGGDNPTGSVTFTLYSDSGCTKSVFTDTETLSSGQATSKSYTPSNAGNYYWIASYGGDSNNNPVSGHCGDNGETSTVTPQTPTLTTNAVDGQTNGTIHDTATLTGGSNPTGTISWDVYNADTDPNCTTPLNTTTLSVNVTGDGTYSSPTFPVSAAGHYEWVATYSGDSNNVKLTTSCNDPNELSTVSTTPQPAIKLIKLEQVNSTSANGYVPGPVHGLVGDTVDYQMTVFNTGNTDLIINFTDQQCDSGTLSGPSVLAGNYNASTQTLSTGGELQYTCSHVLTSSDPSPFVNTANVVGTVPNTNQTVSDQSSVDAYIDTPGIKVVKLQRDGTSGAFTSNDITASVGDTIYYEIVVTNTGDTTLKLSLSDPHCDSGTVQGPILVSGTLTNDTLSAGGVAEYTCWHVVTAADLPSYTNVGTVTGTPPSGPPVQGHGIVVAHITQAGIKVVELASAPCADVDTKVPQPSGIEPCNGNYSSYTTGTIVLQLPGTTYSIPIDYQIRVTNTGNTPLALSLDDPLCDAHTISGPTLVSGTLSGNTLSAGGSAYYTCTHTLTQNDGNTSASGEPFTNTATVTGTPPSGPPVHGTSIVTVNRVPPALPKPRFCRNTKTGKKVKWPKGTPKPKACKPHPSKPRRPHGFTG